ncbi:MAG: hypothetical protein DHS20C13_02660 [Thermodesulfobacteriota bacterium]|nr:MAG: hypothetical protein DHS20C13_02660 [Thermodesulfobacteriota bacterium]
MTDQNSNDDNKYTPYKTNIEDYINSIPLKRFKKLNNWFLLILLIGLVSISGMTTYYVINYEYYLLDPFMDFESEGYFEASIKRQREANLKVYLEEIQELQKLINIAQQDGSLRVIKEVESLQEHANQIYIKREAEIDVREEKGEGNFAASGSSEDIGVYIAGSLIIVLVIAYLTSLYQIFYSKSRNQIKFASDVVKTLTGFFVGVCTAILGV